MRVRSLAAAVLFLAAGLCPVAAEERGPALTDAQLRAVADGQAERRDEVLRRQVEKPYPPDGVWHYADFALAALYRNEKVAEANQAILTLHEKFPVDPEPSREAGQPEREDFHWNINLLHRIWFLFAHDSKRFAGRLTPAVEAALLDIFWQSARKHCRIQDAASERVWWIWGSENHDAMRKSGFWGTAQILKGQPGYRDRRYEDGSTPAEMAAAWNRLFRRYARERAGKGLLVELGSDYGKYTLQGWYNMADFADDPVLRRRMKMLLDLYWADWAVEQIGGVRGGGKHRVYPGRSSIRGLLFGGSGMSWFHFGLGTPGSTHPGHMCAATSDYRPPLCTVDMALDPAGRGTYEYVSRRPGLNVLPKPPGADWSTYVLRPDDGGILRTTWCTPEFVMGTSMVEARPDEEWSAISSQNRWDGAIFAGDPDAMIFFQPRQPKKGSFYNPYWSVQHRGAMVVQKLSARGLGQRVRFGRPLKRVEREGWVFAEAPHAYAAVKVVEGATTWEPDTVEQHREGKGPLGEGMWLSLANPESPVVLEVAPKREWPDFDAFQRAILANPLAYEARVLRYRGLGDAGEITFFADRSRPPLVNGKPLDRQPRKVYDCPFIQSNWGSGVVVLQKGSRREVLDFATPDT